MRFRTGTLKILVIALVAACGDDLTKPVPPPSGKGRPVTAAENLAVSLGVTIMATDGSGAPRLLRAWKPRPVANGMSAEAAARDHVAALAPLWVQKATPMSLANVGTQRLRSGGTVVSLAQQVNGVPVDEGVLRVLLLADGSLGAISGTLLPTVAAPSFSASPAQALDRPLDSPLTDFSPHPTGLPDGSAPSLDPADAVPSHIIA
ncbi:MAG TPA: hypothetical protein VLM79_10750, partial [Kofleriaceae bacterium]|nr:hypothetical protein [Kofleriaceae bacterium]